MKPAAPAIALLLAVAAPAASPAAFPYPWSPPYRYFIEARGSATLDRTLERLGPFSFTTWRPEETTCRDIMFARDAPDIALAFNDGRSVNLLSPGIPEAFFDAYAAEGWTFDPHTPDGFQSWTPPSRAFTNFFATVAGRTFVSESAEAFREALPELPVFPERLPADGVVVEQYTGEALSCAAASVYENTLGPAVAENVATLTLGFDADPERDGALVHAVLAPVPGSELDEWIRAFPKLPWIPGEAEYINRNAIATGALAPLPLLPPFLREVLPEGIPERLANRAVSFALLPPTVDNRTASALFYASTPDPSRSFRTLESWFGPLPTNRVHGRTVLFAPDRTWRFAPLPHAILAGRNAPDDALDDAIDVYLPARPRVGDAAFADPWALHNGFSGYKPRTLPSLVLHADLRPLLNLYPAVGPILCPLLAPRTWDATNDGAPLPLDAILYLQNGNLHLRLRCPPPKYVPITTLCCAALRTYDFRKGTRLVGPPSDPHRKNAHPSPGDAGATPPSLVPPPDGGPSARLPLPPQPFLGWPEAFALTNSRLHAVVVPAIGRLAFLSFAPDAPNLLHLDPDSPDIGGDWVWPVAQSRWPAMAPFGTDWPPPDALADAPCDASAWREPDGSQHVLLTRRYPPPVSATLARHFIVFPHDSPVLRCEQTLSYGPGPIEEIPVPLTLWHVTRVVNPHRFACQIPSPDASPAVLLGAIPPGSWHVNTFNAGRPKEQSSAIYEPPPGSEVKFAFPPARLFTGDSAHLSAHNADANFSVSTRDPATAAVYSNPALGYGQLETLSPEISWLRRDRDAPALSNTLIYWIGPTEKTHHYLKGSQP